jgi:hypothetical protein
MNNNIDEITESFYKLSDQIVEFENKLSRRIYKLEEDFAELSAEFHVETTRIFMNMDKIRKRLEKYQEENK